MNYYYYTSILNNIKYIHYYRSKCSPLFDMEVLIRLSIRKFNGRAFDDASAQDFLLVHRRIKKLYEI